MTQPRSISLAWWTAVALIGVLNAAAYSRLLPLWEGFDEGYHYGYVQSLATTLRFPVARQTVLSREVWRAFELAPVSHYLQSFTKAPVNFSDYFALSQDERVRRRRELETIPANERFQPQPDKDNYEANQSPLPYIGMAGIDQVFAGSPLVVRVLAIRLVFSILAVVLIAHALWLLSRELVIPHPYAVAAWFCAVSSQMLYATICHVCNDSLAVPAMLYLIYAAIRAWRQPSDRNWLVLGIALATALLIKAYFLFLVPLPLAVLAWALWHKRTSLRGDVLFCAPLALFAAPWYARNVILYENLSATIESTSGLHVGQMVHAALSLPWRESIVYTLHAALWTGNNSFVTFSALTLDLALLLLAVGMILYFVPVKRDAAEWLPPAAITLFACGLAAIALAFFISSRGQVNAPMPWYTQPLLPPVLLIAFAGFSRAGRWGQALLSITVLLWGYILAATYVLKLVPLYAGFPPGKAHVVAIWRWYFDSAPPPGAILRTVSLAGTSLTWTLIGLASGLSLILSVWLAASAAFKAVRIG